MGVYIQTTYGSGLMLGWQWPIGILLPYFIKEYSVNCYPAQEKIIIHRKYIKYLHETYSNWFQN